MRHRDHRRDLRPLLRAGLDRHVDPAQLEHLAAHTDVVRIDAGVNLAAGGSARQFVAVIDGAVEVTKASGRTTTAGPGAHIGVAELLHGRPRSVVHDESTECTLVVIFGPAFRAYSTALAATAMTSRTEVKDPPPCSSTIPTSSPSCSPIITDGWSRRSSRPTPHAAATATVAPPPTLIVPEPSLGAQAGTGTAPQRYFLGCTLRSACSAGSRWPSTVDRSSPRASPAARRVARQAARPQPGTRMHREQVIEALWPDVPFPVVGNRLHKAAHFVRKATDTTDSIVLDDRVVALFPNANVTIDVANFETTAAAALRTGDDSRRSVADLYGGELLPDDPYESWAFNIRQRLALRHRELLRLLGLRRDRRRGPH